MNTKFKIFIVIPHFGDKNVTEECLDSISKIRSGNFNSGVIVVDNGSGESFKTKLKNYEIIRNNRNLGFARAVNIGIKKALEDCNTQYILILNNDTIVPSDLFIKLLFAEKRYEERGSRLSRRDVGIRSNNKSCISRPNKSSILDIVAPAIKFESVEEHWVYDYGGRINWLIGRPEHIEYKQLTADSRQSTVDYVSGACMLVRREVFEKIGLFDERFFFYFEDVDLCTRAVKSGFKIEVNPNVVVKHKLGSAIGRWSNKAIFYNLWSNFLFINKHLSWRKPIAWAYLVALTIKIIIDRLINTIISHPRT